MFNKLRIWWHNLFLPKWMRLQNLSIDGKDIHLDDIGVPRVRACLRCGRINPFPYEDCPASKEIDGGGLEPHLFHGDPLTETEKDVLDGVGMTEDVAPIHNPHVCDDECDHGYDESAAEDELENDGNEP